MLIVSVFDAQNCQQIKDLLASAGMLFCQVKRMKSLTNIFSRISSGSQLISRNKCSYTQVYYFCTFLYEKAIYSFIALDSNSHWFY